MNIVLQTKYLRAALLAAADGDLRYYLNAVCVQSTGKEVFIIGTNGHLLLVCRQPLELEAGEWIIPRDVLDAAFSIIKDERPVDAYDDDDWEPFCPQAAELKLDDTGGLFQFHDLQIKFAPVQAKYVNWRKVIPATASGKAGSFAMRYLSLFYDIGCLLTGPAYANPAMAQDGPVNGARLTWMQDPEVLGVLMPLRHDASPPQPWVDEIIATRPQK